MMKSFAGIRVTLIKFFSKERAIRFVYAAIAFLVLVLFMALGMTAIGSVVCVSGWPCPSFIPTTITKDLVGGLGIVSGLVTTIVVAQLTSSDPSPQPENDSDTYANKSLTQSLVVWLYVGVWFVFGSAAFVVGTLLHPDVLPVLTDLGKAFLGVLPGAAYAYFGIKPTK